MAAPQCKPVLTATPQMRSESGLIVRSKHAVWPADTRGRRGGCEPAGKTCYCPRREIRRIASPFNLFSFVSLCLSLSDHSVDEPSPRKLEERDQFITYSTL